MFISDFGLICYLIVLILGLVGLTWWRVWAWAKDADAMHWITSTTLGTIWVYALAVYGLFLIIRIMYK